MASASDKFLKGARAWVGQIGAGGVADASTATIPLSSTTNLPTDTAVVATIDRVDASGDDTPSLEEVVIGVVSGSSLVTCTRGVEGTAQAHSAGAVVEILYTATNMNYLIDGLLVQHDQAGRHTNITASNVTASGTSTLTTINNTTLTSSGVQTLSHVSASDITFRRLSPNLGSDAQGDIYYHNGTSITRLGAGTSGQYLKTQGASANPVWADISASSDGWTASSDTWTYASASTFTIAGVDRTAVYTKGTKLKFTQTTTKYAVVVSSSFSTDTTVTIAVNTDYTIANAAITSPNYSYQANPQGFPTYFNFALTHTSAGGAYTNNPTTNRAVYWFYGATVYFELTYTYHATPGGSGASRISGLPVAPGHVATFTAANYNSGLTLNAVYDTGVSAIVIFKYDATSPITASHIIGVSGFYKI